jgi:hypothetical protein
MATIDKLDLSVYNQYAIRSEMIRQFESQIQMEKAAAIPSHTQISDNYPKLPEVDLLLGLRTAHAPWAMFTAPKEFRELRRSPFNKRHRIAPSFEGVQSEMENLLDSYDPDKERDKDKHEKEEEKEEQTILKECFTQMNTINGWLGEIIGNIGRFVQG